MARGDCIRNLLSGQFARVVAANPYSAWVTVQTGLTYEDWLVCECVSESEYEAD